MNSFDNKVVLVTGSSRGIGAAIAIAFAEQGAHIALHGRDSAALSHVQAEIEKTGGRATRFYADVTQLSELETMRSQIESQLGPVDVLVANAGGNHTPPCNLEDVSEEGWRASIDGNLTATFLTLKCFLPGMKQRRRGSIVTLSSAAGRRANAQTPIPYAVAKTGIELLTQDVAAQAGPFNVRANCIAPETILTERSRVRIPSEQQAALVNYHPLKRLGIPSDVAQAAVFLASDSASWITGIVLDVAGGAVMPR